MEEGPQNLGDTLIVFARAPRPGQVKSRLAVDVGDEEAARIYAEMGRGIVEGVVGGGYRTIIAYDPPDAEHDIVAWLDEGDFELVPQRAGDLGERLSGAIQDAFVESDRVAVIGTDSPGVDRAVVEEAFTRLDRCDVVLGPSFDGGFYLLGLVTPVPSLLRDIPWSSGKERGEILRRARVRDLRVDQMVARIDVDTIEDLRALEASGETA
jgi:hypothetical protein